MCVSRRHHPPDPVPLVERGDHGRRVLGHERHQQLQHIMNILVLWRRGGAVRSVQTMWRDRKRDRGGEREKVRKVTVVEAAEEQVALQGKSRCGRPPMRNTVSPPPLQCNPSRRLWPIWVIPTFPFLCLDVFGPLPRAW